MIEAANNPTPPTTRSTPTGKSGLGGSPGGITPISTTRARLTAQQELILMEICRETLGDTWKEDHQYKVWIRISEEFEKRARRTFSWQSCQRRFKACMKKEMTRRSVNLNWELPSTPAGRLASKWISESKMIRLPPVPPQLATGQRDPSSMMATIPQTQEYQEHEQAAKAQAWQERMDKWMNTSTDPQNFSHETLPAVNNTTVGEPAEGIVQKDNVPPPAKTAAEPVYRKDLQEISDKIDRVAENILNSTQRLLKEVQLQQRREMEEFRDRIMTLIRDESDLISQNITSASEDLSESLGDLTMTTSITHNNILESMSNIMKLRRDSRVLLKIAAAEGKINPVPPCL
ncbi:hypothetical protein ANI_1_2576014 [Paecilomyces variotii No. 5]|uniref:Uncharacterized protein n=1 Tax=Byssochlamys spectabilis (strain No. 5 / NBRC 109023) TaxID=1356009 RepID=V5G7L2_BYSSN|nr:hypothetical protein ANI_1_2576014 [Paecilomyces variotii No. 5]